MATKYTVTAVDRSGIGHPNCHRAKRSWPSGQAVEVEVLDQDDDPMVTEEIHGAKRTYPDPKRIGRLSWASMRADKPLMIAAVGSSPEDAEMLQKKIADLQSAVAAASARAELSEREVVRLKGDVAERIKEAETLREKIAELEKQLDEATAPKATKPGKGKG